MNPTTQAMIEFYDKLDKATVEYCAYWRGVFAEYGFQDIGTPTTNNFEMAWKGEQCTFICYPAQRRGVMVYYGRSQNAGGWTKILSITGVEKFLRQNNLGTPK